MPSEFSVEALPAIRAELEARVADARPANGPEAEVFHVPGRDGAPQVPVHIYRPDGPARAGRAAILHIHGGGMILGSPRSVTGPLPDLVQDLGVLGVSVEYRLAPETTFPGPQEDCYAALAWLVESAQELGVDPSRIVVMGESAGGGLAAALGQMVRDRAEYSLAGQVLIYPMLDHRTGGPECPWRNPIAGEFVWPAASNQFGWACLRGTYEPVDDRKGLFSPPLADSLAGLPQAFVSAAGLDLLADEDMDYARRMRFDGVPVEFHLYPGALHGFDMLPNVCVTQQAQRDIRNALVRMFGLS